MEGAARRYPWSPPPPPPPPRPSRQGSSARRRAQRDANLAPRVGEGEDGLASEADREGALARAPAHLRRAQGVVEDVQLRDLALEVGVVPPVRAPHVELVALDALGEAGGPAP